MRKRQVGLLAAGLVGASIGFAAVYILTSKQDLRAKAVAWLNVACGESKKAAETMTEDMVLKRAKLTNDPAVVQDWTDMQWERLGF